jgi:DNA-binding XRE family transcriptional regulator
MSVPSPAAGQRRKIHNEKSWSLQVLLMRIRSDHIVRNKLGRTVRRLRQSLRLSQSDLAERAETDQGFISELERGVANPTLDLILRIAKALRVDVVDLFGLK